LGCTVFLGVGILTRISIWTFEYDETFEYEWSSYFMILEAIKLKKNVGLVDILCAPGTWDVRASPSASRERQSSLQGMLNNI
jgi:hypothetical protein